MRPSIENIEQHIEQQVVKSPSGCWLWLGYKDRNGYGSITIKRQSKGVHRVQWELKNGAIPKGMFICHTCDVPSCVNIAHLFLGTHTDNMQDKVHKGRDFNKSKTQCVRQHAFTVENTRVRMFSCGRTQRICKECDALRSRLYRSKRKANG